PPHRLRFRAAAAVDDLRPEPGMCCRAEAAERRLRESGHRAHRGTACIEASLRAYPSGGRLRPAAQAMSVITNPRTPTPIRIYPSMVKSTATNVSRRTANDRIAPTAIKAIEDPIRMIHLSPIGSSLNDTFVRVRRGR